jgi:hypothetical protein
VSVKEGGPALHSWLCTATQWLLWHAELQHRATWHRLHTNAAAVPHDRHANAGWGGRGPNPSRAKPSRAAAASPSPSLVGTACGGSSIGVALQVHMSSRSAGSWERKDSHSARTRRGGVMKDVSTRSFSKTQRKRGEVHSDASRPPRHAHANPHVTYETWLVHVDPERALSRLALKHGVEPKAVGLNSIAGRCNCRLPHRTEGDGLAVVDMKP